MTQENYWTLKANDWTLNFKIKELDFTVIMTQEKYWTLKSNVWTLDFKIKNEQKLYEEHVQLLQLNKRFLRKD